MRTKSITVEFTKQEKYLLEQAYELTRQICTLFGEGEKCELCPFHENCKTHWIVDDFGDAWEAIEEYEFKQLKVAPTGAIFLGKL